MRELLDIFAEALITGIIVTAIIAVLHVLYYIGEYMIETAYEKYYGARDWETKWKQHKSYIKGLLDLAKYMALFGTGVLFAGYASDWFVASVYKIIGG